MIPLRAYIEHRSLCSLGSELEGVACMYNCIYILDCPLFYQPS